MAEAQSEVRFRSSLSVDVTRGLLMLSGTGSGQDFAILSNLSIPGSGSGAFISPVSSGGVGSGFAMLGLSQASGLPTHLLVSIGGLTVINGDLFADTFPGYSENELIASLFNNTQLARDFLLTQFNSTFQSNGAMSPVVSFSQAEHVGGITFEVVDVPGPASLCAMPLILLMRRRRR